MNGLRANSKGAALVEFAVVLLLLLVLVFGIIDFGSLIFHKLNITQAAREGARTAAVGATTSKITDKVLACSTVGLTSQDVTLQKGDPDTNTWVALANSQNGTENDASPGGYIRVNVVLQHKWITGFFSSESTVPLRAEMTIRRE